LSARWNWHNLTQLGFSKKDAALVAETLSSQTGLILVAGATGGGKTTTLYSLTTVVDVGGKVIASIEDPVEYAIPGVRQIQVDSEHGFTMPEGLRLLLRMDPDMILVGEIRDPASANIAARASLTGALVAATIHAPDSFGAVAALQHLSVPKYVIGGALRMIITQELLPTLCLQCIELRAITPDERLAFDAHGLTPPDALKESRGCHACHGLGRAGRTAVAEILPVSMAAGQEIASGAVRSGLARCLEESRESTLARNALLRAAEGVVPMNSVQRLILSRRGSKTGGVGNE
jgi:type II secretory ATPase GspE/PulE/Tfp pilus assembly ATPase PilB-like protein